MVQGGVVSRLSHCTTSNPRIHSHATTSTMSRVRSRTFTMATSIRSSRLCFDVSSESVPFINQSVDLTNVKPEGFCRERDMVFADASEDLDDVGKCIELVKLRGEKVLSGTHTILARPKSPTPVSGFGGHLFRSEQIRKQIRKEGQGAKVAGISPTRLGTIEVCYPPDEDEQQKIADCLGSLDNWIAAAGRKLAAPPRPQARPHAATLPPTRPIPTPTMFPRVPESAGLGKEESRGAFYRAQSQR